MASCNVEMCMESDPRQCSLPAEKIDTRLCSTTFIKYKSIMEKIGHYINKVRKNESVVVKHLESVFPQEFLFSHNTVGQCKGN